MGMQLTQLKQALTASVVDIEKQKLENLPDVAECNDFATGQDNVATCPVGDCCASMKEYFTLIDEDTNEKSTVTIGRHGCESDINHNLEHEVLCSNHPNDCFNVENANLPDHHDNNVTVTDIEICFCDKENCNNDDPLPPEPTTDAADTTKTGLKCYNCGHRKNENGEEEKLPDVPECNDFATAEDNVATCPVGDCCASMREYFIHIDEDTNEKSTVTIGRHGCESDINHN